MNRGIVMEIKGRHAMVFNKECGLVKIQAKPDMFVGQAVPMDAAVKAKVASAPARPVYRRRVLAGFAAAIACLVFLGVGGSLLNSVVSARSVAVVLSVLGTSNGLILGYIRLPYALGLRNEMFWSEKFAKLNLRFDIPFFSAVFTFVVSMFWLLLHFASTTGAIFMGWTMFSGMSVDEISIVLIYIFMILIYFGVLKQFFQKKVDSWVFGALFPILAILGAATAVYGGFQSPKVAVYLTVSILGIVAGLDRKSVV